MSRLMSVSHTEQAVRDRRKTVTRRLGWTFLKPGDRLTLCRKVMGRKPGEPLERIAEVEVVDVLREPLDAIPDSDIELEAVPGMESVDADEWIAWYCRTFNARPSTTVTRIEWRYL